MAAFSPKYVFILFFTFIINGFAQLRAQPDSIIYKPAHYKPDFITDLPEPVKETSGLLFINGQLWTINDSGNRPEIYQIDTITGEILRTVVVANSSNADWECITQDKANVYIGDFGNNYGNRTDLHILKIAKTGFFNRGKDTVNAAYINFSYSDQTHFGIAFNKNNFDCEAFFVQNDSLHLFSKDWVDKHTKHYVIPVDTGNYIARLVESFNSDGLITDASINSQGHIVLLGYTNKRGKSYTCFVWLLSGYGGQCFFNGNKTRLELGSALHLGQTEGIVLKNDNTGWISSESIQADWFYKPAKLFRFDFGYFY